MAPSYWPPLSLATPCTTYYRVSQDTGHLGRSWATGLWCTMVLCFISSCRPSPNLVRLLGHLKQSSSSPPSITSPWLDPCHAELAEELLELAEVGPGGGEDAVLHHLEEAVHGGALPPPWWGSSRAAGWCRCPPRPCPPHTPPNILHRTGVQEDRSTGRQGQGCQQRI